jgi:hypothetical protein
LSELTFSFEVIDSNQEDQASEDTKTSDKDTLFVFLFKVFSALHAVVLNEEISVFINALSWDILGHVENSGSCEVVGAIFFVFALSYQIFS